MPLLWNDTLATGIRQVDLQHQELIELINALEQANAAGRRQEALEECLPRLSAYMLFHFGTEEAMLLKADEAHASRHRTQHREFTDRITALRTQPPESIDLSELVAYLQRWLVEHIMKTDRDLARQVKTPFA